MLYEALAGRVPFEGESAVAVAMKQVSQAPQRPSSINPQVSPALDAVVMRALEKSPGDRFQNADAFIAALDAALKRRRRAARRHRRLRAAAPGRRALERGGGEMDAREEEERRRRRRLLDAWPPSPLLIAADRDLRPHPRHHDRSPERHRQPLNVAIALLAAERLQGRRRSSACSAKSPAGHRARAGPGRRAAGRRSAARLRLPQLLLLEADGRPHGQRRARAARRSRRPPA